MFFEEWSAWGGGESDAPQLILTLKIRLLLRLKCFNFFSFNK